MCLAVPAKIISIQDNLAVVDFGHGTTREVDVTLVDAELGQYILVHTGYAIKVIDEEEAKLSQELWREILEAMGEESQI